VPSIEEPYAMNVCTNGQVWIYYWDDFPLAVIEDKKIKHYWEKSPIQHSHGIAISEDGKQVVFAGGSKRGTFPFVSQEKRLFRVWLETFEAEEFEIRDVDNNKYFAIACRNNRLYLKRVGEEKDGLVGRIFVLELGVDF